MFQIKHSSKERSLLPVEVAARFPVATLWRRSCTFQQNIGSHTCVVRGLFLQLLVYFRDKMSQTAVLLYSSLATDQIQVVNSRRLEDVLKGNKIQFEKVDGSYPDNKDLRDILFGVSGQRGKYPQCFLKDDSGSYTFVGLWEEVESLVECDTIPAEVLAANPQIKTFAQV